MKKLLFTLSLMLSVFTAIFAQNVDISGAIGNSNATSCTSSSVTIGGSLMCMNYTFDNSTFSVSNDTIYVSIYYTVGLICLPAIVPFTQTVTIGNVPPNTYHIYAKSYLNNALQDVYSLSTMTVTSCCSAYPQISLSSNPVCVGDTLIMQNTGFGQTTEEWYIDGFLFSNNNTASQPTYTPGSMTIKLVVSNSTCADSVTQVVNIQALPEVNLGNDTSICDGLTLTKTLPNTFSSYTWSSGSTTNSGQISTVGSLSVTVTNNYGCENSDTLNLLNLIPLAQVNAGPDVQVCVGDIASITASSPQTGATFSWSNGTQGSTLNTPNSGTYFVTVSAPGFCNSKDTVQVIAFITTPIAFIANTDSCAPRGIKINDDYLYYMWSNGGQTDSVTINQAETLAVTVTDTNGCMQSSSMYFDVYDLPNVFIGNDTLICEETSLVLSANVLGTYNWSTGQTVPAISVINAGVYWLEVTDNHGCVGADTMMLSVKVCVGLDELNAVSTFNAYPNPAQDVLIIESHINDLYVIYNQLGEVVQTVSVTAGKNELKISNLNAGVYFIRNSNAESIRIVKY